MNSLLSSFTLWILVICSGYTFANIIETRIKIQDIVIPNSEIFTSTSSSDSLTQVTVGLIDVRLSETVGLFENDSHITLSTVESLYTQPQRPVSVHLQCGSHQFDSAYTQSSPFNHILPLHKSQSGPPIVSVLSKLFGRSSHTNILTFALPLQLQLLSSSGSPVKELFRSQLSEDSLFDLSYMKMSTQKPLTSVSLVSVQDDEDEGMWARTDCESVQSLSQNTNTNTATPTHTPHTITHTMPADTQFLSLGSRVGASVGGTNFGEISAPKVEAVVTPLVEVVSGAFLTQTLFFIANNLPPLLDVGLEHLVVEEVISSINQPLNVIFPYSITEIVQHQLPPLVANNVANNVAEDVTMRITNTVNQQVIRTLARTLPETVEAAASSNIITQSGGDLAHILTLALSGTLTPTLLHTLTHDPQQDYFCYYCDKKELYCTFCHQQRSETARQNYYAEYYAGYYSRYYSSYYVGYFRDTWPEVEKRAKQEMLQTMHTQKWAERDVLVLEEYKFEREDDHLKYKHMSPPEGVIEHGPSGGVGEAWGGY